MSQDNDRPDCPLQSTFIYFISLITEDNFVRVTIVIRHFSDEESEVQSG